MPKILEREALLSDLAAVNELLSERSEDDDPIGWHAYLYRKQELEKQLENLEGVPERLGNAALTFSGEPVLGSRAIDASFTASILARYQDLVARLFADRAGEGGLPEHGPIPYRDLSALHITDVAHGSFGFILSERDTGQSTLFESPMKQTLDHATAIISAFGAYPDDEYVSVVENINQRVFASVKDLFAVLHDARASMRIVEGERDELLDPVKIERAYERSQSTAIEDITEELPGVLIGVLPTTMQFEFEPEGRDPISGKTGPNIGRTYLERIHNNQPAAGWHCVATILTRTTVRPTGQVSKKFTLLNLSIP